MESARFDGYWAVRPAFVCGFVVRRIRRVRITAAIAREAPEAFAQAGWPSHVAKEHGFGALTSTGLGDEKATPRK